MLLGIIFSCDKKVDANEEAIRTYIENNADNPSSYEPLETKVIDTLITGDLAKSKISSLKIDKEIVKSDIEITNLKKEMSSVPDTYNQLIETHKKRLSVVDDEIKEVSSKLQNKDVYGYVVYHKFRGKNKLNALVLNEMYFFIDAKNEVKATEKTSKKLMANIIEDF